MKKILALVLVMAVSVMAVTFTGVDNGDGTVTISYNAPIVGMALDVNSATVSVTGVTLPAFFDVFMDYAYAQGASYVYMSGNPIATIGAAGVATLPSSAFCISAGGLEDNAQDTVPAAGSIVLAVTGTGDITIGANSLRGGVVDYSGAMTTNLPITVTVADVTPSICMGDTDEDGWLTINDAFVIVGLLNNYAADDYEVEVSAGYEAYDLDDDGWITINDAFVLVGTLNNYAADDYEVECAN
jgi:hypothetical protein